MLARSFPFMSLFPCFFLLVIVPALGARVLGAPSVSLVIAKVLVRLPGPLHIHLPCDPPSSLIHQCTDSVLPIRNLQGSVSRERCAYPQTDHHFIAEVEFCTAVLVSKTRSKAG